MGRGKVPNPFAEMGLAAELKYDQRAFIARSAATLAASAVVIGAAWHLLQPRSRPRRASHSRPRWISPDS